MKRQFSITLAALLAATFILCGCSSKEPAAAKPKAPADAKQPVKADDVPKPQTEPAKPPPAKQPQLAVSIGSEPPMSFGGANPGQMIRSTDLVDLNPAEDRMVYKISYPAYGLDSVAVISFRSKAMLEETFDGKWKVIYSYDSKNRPYRQIPASFKIYKHSNGGYGALVNEYVLKEIRLGESVYQDASGRSKVVKMDYFIVVYRSGPGLF